MSNAWINFGTAATGSTWTNNVFTTTQTVSGTAMAGGWYIKARSSYELSESDAILLLEASGHRILKKKNHVVKGFPNVSHYSLDDPLGPLATVNIHYGYALPEMDGDYLMPDGSTLKIDSYGNYQVLDQDAKVTYKANRIREFSPYINASDLLESFIKEVGRIDGVNQGEILRLPIEAFINWLILRAATKDGDSLEGLPSVEKALPAPIPKKPRCLACGRFMSRMWAAARIPFCSESHFSKYQKRLSYG